MIYLGIVGMGHEDQNPETKCGTDAIKAKFGSSYLILTGGPVPTYVL